MSPSETYGSSMLPQGSRVVLVVSRGPSGVTNHSYSTMPDVVGKSQGAALETLAESHLQTQVVYDFHPTARKGSVTATLPQAGVSVPVGSEALILVSSGPVVGERQAVELPDVTGMHESEAAGVLSAAGLSPQIFYMNSDTVNPNYVVEQLPNKTTYARPQKATKIANWVLIGLLAVALLVGGYFMLNESSPISIIKSSSSPSRTKVPDLTDLSVAQATKELRDAGFQLGTITEESNAEVIAGRVIAYLYAGKRLSRNDSAPKNAKIAMVVSAGSSDQQMSTIPDVVGKPEDEAQRTLRAAGFKVSIKRVPDESVDAGLVIEVAPKAGSQLPIGGEVEMVVSRGASTEMVEVPDVTGIDEAAAQVALETVGLEIKVTKSSSATVPEGMVIKGAPTSGTEVKRGSVVVVVISTGSSTVLVPDVVGSSLEQARAELESSGLVAKVSPATAIGSITKQDPVAGISVKKGSTVTLYAE